jgi:hypothetical protein
MPEGGDHMTTIVAVSGIGAWILLIGAAIAGIAFGMLLNTLVGGGRKKK